MMGMTREEGKIWWPCGWKRNGTEIMVAEVVVDEGI